MSGGYFQYIDSNLKSQIFGWTDKPDNEFQDVEITELVWNVLDLIHDFDWYMSGDTCEETWLKKKAEFKKKWFQSERKDRIKRIVDDALKDTKEELYKTFDLED